MRNRRGMRLGLGGAQARPPPAWIWGVKGSPSPAQLQPRCPPPAGFPGQQDSRPSAAPAGPSFWCPSARRQVSASQVSASQVSARKWRPDPAGAEGARGGGGGGGGRRRPARRRVRGQGRLRRAAPSGPAGAARSKSGSRAGAGAQR